LAESNAVPIIVLSRQQDPVEIINSTLRNAGHPAHCQWARDLTEFGEALIQHPPQLIFICLADPEETGNALEARARLAARVPTLLVRDKLAEEDLIHGIELGVQDVVTLNARGRLQAVADRELQASHLDQALSGTLASARQYHDQMKSFMSGSTDALANVQEGILVDVNPAWVDLFGHRNADDIVGQPLMDLFDVASHAALKGALVAAVQGRWAKHALDTVAALPNGGRLPLDIHLERFEFEGEAAVQLRVATQKRDLESMTRQLEEAVRRDAATGMLRRSSFLEQATARAAQPVKAGMRAVAYLEPDKFEEVETDHGPLAAEEALESVGQLINGLLQPDDLAGRITSRGIAVLYERGNTLDLEAWLKALLHRLDAAVIKIGGETVAVACSAGLAALNSQGEPLRQPLDAAINAQQNARAAGGNRLQRQAPAVTTGGELAEADRLWAAQIKSALMANRFRLVQQPIASLVGDDLPMFDLVVRMLDESGQEVLPSEFMPAAQRTDLLKHIDRWVMGAALAFCTSRDPHRVFVRLSADSVKDHTLAAWLTQQIRTSGVAPDKLVIELTGDVLAQNPRDARNLQTVLAGLGAGLALERFGTQAEPASLLGRVPLQFVKIDGSLMQGLANDHQLQQQVRSLVDMARAHGVHTIAERVEDANTMAVLWQIGVEFIQGYFVNEPEQVVLG